MSNLSEETTDRIEKEAEAYAESHGDHLSNIKEYSTYNDIVGAYNAGATEWAGRAQGLVNLLEDIKRMYPGSLLASRVSTALTKYKEVGNG
jgi:hypothetical protein